MLLARRFVTCVALLAFAPGCSGGSGGLGVPEKKTVLYPVLNEQGFVTYSTKDPYDPSVEAHRRIALSEQEQRVDLDRVRQQNMRDEYLRRQERQGQFRAEQSDFQAYLDTRRAQESERREVARNQSMQDERMRPTRQYDEPQQFERNSQALDRALRALQQQQERDYQQRQQELLRRSNQGLGGYR